MSVIKPRGWQESYRLVGEFLDEHGRLPSYRAHDRHERRLGIWIHNQRVSYRKVHTGLTEVQVQFLQILPGFFPKERKPWWVRYIEVFEFVATNERQPSVCSSNATERRLAKWVSNQRTRYRGLDPRHVPFTEQQVDALRKLPGFLTARDVPGGRFESHSINSTAGMRLRIADGTVEVQERRDDSYATVWTLTSDAPIIVDAA